MKGTIHQAVLKSWSNLLICGLYSVPMSLLTPLGLILFSFKLTEILSPTSREASLGLLSHLALLQFMPAIPLPLELPLVSSPWQCLIYYSGLSPFYIQTSKSEKKSQHLI